MVRISRCFRRVGPVAARLPRWMALACVLVLTADGAAQVSVDTAGCDRADGSLTRFLLCAELQVRRPPATHATYYAELDDLDVEIEVLRERLEREGISTR